MKKGTALICFLTLAMLSGCTNIFDFGSSSSTSITDPSESDYGTSDTLSSSEISNRSSEVGYTVTWENWDGTILEVDSDVPYGSYPAYGGLIPTKDGNNQYSYSFSGWSPEITEVTEDITYTALFNESTNSYTVTWRHWEGTILEIDKNVPYGSQPSYDGEEPESCIKKVDTAKIDYSYYIFSGWSPKLGPVVGDVNYVANYNRFDIAVDSSDGEKFIEILRVSLGDDNDKLVIPDTMHIEGEDIPVTHIGDFAFVQSLRSVSLPESITYISQDAFSGCKSLKFNEYAQCRYLGNDSNPYFALIQGMDAESKEVSIHPNTKIIASYAFQQYESLLSLSIPDSVTHIGSNAFRECYKLKSVTMGENLKVLYGSTFWWCKSLTYVSIPDSVTSLIGYDFSGCLGLRTVVLGSSITFVGPSLFGQDVGICKKISRIYYKGTEEDFLAIKFEKYQFMMDFYAEWCGCLFLYSETPETGSCKIAGYKTGGYWHYVNGVPTMW